MNRKLIFIIYILFFISHPSVAGQNPYTYVQVKILDADTTNIQEQYNLFFRKQNSFSPDKWDRTNGWKMKYYKERGFFEEGDLGQYCKEIIEIKITHQNDTMMVRIQKDDLPNNEPCIGIATFHLEIPFQKGYYEISNFIHSRKGLVITDNYEWIELPIRAGRLKLKNPTK